MAILFIGACLTSAACGSGKSKSDADYEADVVANTYQLVKVRVNAIHNAALDLQSAAPTPPDRGWDATLDAAAIVQMKNAWRTMRRAWEGGEGVLTSLFPNLDESMDSRYEDLLAGGDADPFDGSGIVGMHAIERIIYAPDIPPQVVAKESTDYMTMGYQPAAWPSTPDEAAEFKNGLCEKLVEDSQMLATAWQPTAIKLADSFQGLTSLMGSQQEKVISAADHAEESRYSQTTMSDLRNNLSGTIDLYNLYIEWLGTKTNGVEINAEVESAFDILRQTYATVDGDAVPAPPEDWTSSAIPPSPADQQTPFGILYSAVVQAVDPSRTGSAVNAMNHAAGLLSLPMATDPPLP